MGTHHNISYDKFPKQGDMLNKQVKVCFNYDTTKKINGEIIRDDIEEPFKLLIMLEDKRVVDAIECQYSILD